MDAADSLLVSVVGTRYTESADNTVPQTAKCAGFTWQRQNSLVALVGLCPALLCCNAPPVPVSLPYAAPPRIAESASTVPPTMLWAWHGTHDFRGVGKEHGNDVGVAYLARTIRLSKEGAAMVLPRRSPLQFDPETRRWAVVRIEVETRLGLTTLRATLNRIAEEISRVYREPNVSGLQIDFDCPRSLRPGYLELLSTLRATMPSSWVLSMTALGSWCVADRWLKRAPVDLVVPMLFGPGHEQTVIANHLRTHRALPESRCNRFHGIRQARSSGSGTPADPTEEVSPLPANQGTDTVLPNWATEGTFAFPAEPWTPDRVRDWLSAHPNPSDGSSG